MKQYWWPLVLVFATLTAQAQTGIVTFSQATYSVSDTASTATITIVSSVAPDQISSITFQTSDGTATTGTDYQATSAVLNFGPGVLTNTVSIPLTADGKLVFDRTVNMTLTNPVGSVVLGSPSNAVLTIRGFLSPQARFFPISLKAFLTTSGNGSNSAAKFKIGNNAFAGSDRLVLMLDAQKNALALGTLDPSSKFTFLARSTTAAFLSTGQFDGNIELINFSILSNPINIIGTGDVHIKGRTTPNSNTNSVRLGKAKLFGVFNDSVNGNSNASDALIKGTISPAGVAVNPTAFSIP